MHRVFLDTDIILDLFIRRDPHHKRALQFFSFLKRLKVKSYTSPVVVANTYYLLAKTRDKNYALEKVKRLRDLIRIAMLDERIIDAAMQTPHRDFEDSIQYHCAVAGNIKFLVTRNVADYPKGKLHVLLPEEYMKMVAAV